MKITIDDINRRQSMRTDKFKAKGSVIGESRIYTENGVFCENNAINTIQNLENLSENSNAAFNKALDVFSELFLNSNESVIRTQCYFLLENVDKVRDATQLMNSIKYKNSRLKTKITTKINNKLGNVNNAITSAIGNITNTITKAGIASGGGSTGVANEQVVDKYFNMLYEAASKAKQCDRVLENYSKISKNFDIDYIVESNEGDIYQTCYDIAECVDQYNSSFKARYSAALETSYYSLAKNHIYTEPEKIIESVTDYFIFRKGLSEHDISDIKSLSTSSVLFEECDFNDSAYMWQIPVSDEDTSIDFIDPDRFGNDLNMFTESLEKTLNQKKNDIKHAKKQVKKDVKEVNKMLKYNAKHGNPEEKRDEEVKQMVDEFRDNCAKEKDGNKNIISLKGLVNKIFTRTPFQIINELPSIFSIIRASFIISTVAINPILGVVTLITDQIIKLTLERKQMEKIINAYTKELETVKGKIDKAKNDDDKDRYTKYRDELKKDLEKLREYDRNNFSEEENDERGAYDYDDDFDDSDYNLDDDDWDFDDDDWDTDFDDEKMDEASYTTGASICVMANLMTTLSETLIDDNLDGMVCDNILKLSNDDIDVATDFVITVPVLHERKKLCEALTVERDNLRRLNNRSVEESKRIDCLNENIYKFSNIGSTHEPKTMKENMIYIKSLQELANINGEETYVTEMEFTNTLKLAINNLKRTALKLSDKEKKISNEIDVSVNNVSKGMEQAVMNGNREAVIKGRIIPSASKCIKLALATGAAWAINPAVAVIGALGTFICMKKMQNKERQLVLDDIEIELKMCERYISQAENNNDLKKVRDLEKIQRNLERQHQRIKYKMNVEHDMRVPNSTDKPNGAND